MSRATHDWRGRMVALLSLALLVAGCGGAPVLTTPTAPASSATKPAAAPTPVAPVATVAATTAPAPPKVFPTVAATASPVVTKPAAASPAVPPSGQGEPWLVEGKPVTQAALVDERRRFVTTATGLYALTGDAVEQRATTGPWPNLVAAGPTTLISGERMSCGRGDGGVALRRSVDGGRSWQPTQGPGGRGPLQARPVPTFGGSLFAVACDGLYRSADAGATWTVVPVLEPGMEPVDVAVTPDGARLLVVVLVGEGGSTRLLASDRQADGWASPRTLRESWGGGVVSIGRDGGRLMIYLGGPLGVEVSRDAGATWQALNAGLDSTRLLADPRGAPLPAAEEAKLMRGASVYSLAPLLDKPTVLLGGGDGIYRLEGTTWRKLPALNGQIVREVFHDVDGTGYARSDVGVVRLGK